MKIHPDIRFTIVAVTVFAMVAVLIPMAMLLSGCQAMSADRVMPAQGNLMGNLLNLSSRCTMVKDPALPDASGSGGSGIASLLLAIIAVLAVAIAALSLPAISVTRAIVPVAAAPPLPPPEPSFGERLRL